MPQRKPCGSRICTVSEGHGHQAWQTWARLNPGTEWFLLGEPWVDDTDFWELADTLITDGLTGFDDAPLYLTAAPFGRPPRG